MKLTFTEAAWNDYLWMQEHNRPLLKRLNEFGRTRPRFVLRKSSPKYRRHCEEQRDEAISQNAENEGRDCFTPLAMAIPQFHRDQY